MIYKHFDLLSQAENKKKCGWRISFKNRTADFFIKFNISQTKMKTILSFSKGKCDTRYPHYSVLMSIPLLKTRTVADENPPRKNCCYCSPFGLSPMLVIEYTHYAHQKTVLSAGIKSMSKRKQAVAYIAGLKNSFFYFMRWTRWKNWTTKSTYKMLKWLFKIPSAMLKKSW